MRNLIAAIILLAPVAAWGQASQNLCAINSRFLGCYPNAGVPARTNTLPSIGVDQINTVTVANLFKALTVADLAAAGGGALPLPAMTSINPTQFLWEDGTWPITSEGGSGNKNYFGFSKTWNSGNAGGGGVGPLSTLQTFANSDGTTKDVVSLLATTVVRQSNGVGFAGNFVVRTDAGVTGAHLAGIEIDVIPVNAGSVSAGFGMAINAFNANMTGTTGLIISSSGGLFENGIGCGAVMTTGSCFAPTNTIHPNSLIDATPTTYGEGAMVMGRGLTQGLTWRIPSSGARIYSDATNPFLVVVQPTNGILFQNSGNSATVMALTNSALTVTGSLISNGTTFLQSLVNIAGIAAPGSPGVDNFFLYVDLSDHKLKAKGSSGTVTILALP